MSLIKIFGFVGVISDDCLDSKSHKDLCVASKVACLEVNAGILSCLLSPPPTLCDWDG